jgi:hypothetical protein
MAPSDVYNFHYYFSTGEFEVDVMGIENLPLGRALLVLVLALRGRMLLQLQGVAYVVMRVNYEIARAQGVV